MTAQFGAGFALSLALILPIGAQNVFILNQGLRFGLPRALVSGLTAAVCDIILIGGAHNAPLIHGHTPWRGRTRCSGCACCAGCSYRG